MASTVVVIPDNIAHKQSGRRLRRSNLIEGKLTPWQKLKFSYQGRYSDPKLKAASDRSGTALFWYMAVSGLYIFTAYFVPLALSDYSDTVRYYAKVFCWFGFIQTTANWACIRFTETAYSVTRDRPECEADVNARRQTMDHHSYDNNQSMCSTLTSECSDVSFKWQWCHVCYHYKPSRCHHCIVCNRCILKRDHHCYITGRCIGFSNQRYFIMMNFYIAIFSLTLFFYEIRYLSNHFAPRATYADYFLPVTVYKMIFGDVELHQLVMVSHMYTTWWIGTSALTFFVWHIAITAYGYTTREVLKAVNVRCTGSLTDNFRSVFGPMWMFNFVMPAQIFFRQNGDGIHWTNLKPT